MIYLDNAATSFPKPACVPEAVARALAQYGNPGRGSHRLALSAAEKLYECREAVARLFDADQPTSVIFTSGNTAALNLVIKGLLRKGDHVLTSDLEHNAVFRPLAKLQKERGVLWETFRTTEKGRRLDDDAICKNLLAKLRKNTKLVLCTHASNICSITLPVEKIGKICRAYGVLFCVDAAQSAGHIPLSVREAKIDALCLPGHKGLFGPMGCGCIILSSACRPEPLLEGGSGYRSLEWQMPRDLPERYEAGTLPLPAICGLLSGVSFVEEVGIAEIGAHEAALTARLRERLTDLGKVHLYAPEENGGILLFSSPQLQSSALAEELDARGFCVRAGFHCAALAHRALGTPEGGAVRVSPGYFNTLREIDAFADALCECLK